LAATPEETAKRVITAVTDPARKYRSDPGHPDICNVFSLHKFFNIGMVEDIMNQCKTAEIGCVDCKKLLATGINNTLREFRERRKAIGAKPQLVNEVMEDGAARAKKIAMGMLYEVKEKMNLVRKNV
jgi:tryptophanyl-tRNA synthetase